MKTHRMHAKGGVLLETLIVGVVMAIATIGLLNLYNFSRDIFIESKQRLVAINAIDVIMNGMEAGITSSTGTPADTGGDFDDFAHCVPGYTTMPLTMDGTAPAELINLYMIPQGPDINNTVLSQLPDWNIDISSADNSNGSYSDRLVKVRITWDGVRKDGTGNPIRLREEIFSVFTSRTW